MINEPAAVSARQPPFAQAEFRFIRPDGTLVEPQFEQKTIGRTDYWAELCISAGFNQPLMEFELAVGLPLTDPGPLRGSVWYDTERDVAAFAWLCWREAHLRPRGKSPAFPYLRHRDWRPLVGAVVRLIRRWTSPLAPGVRNPLPEFVASKPYQAPST